MRAKQTQDMQSMAAAMAQAMQVSCAAGSKEPGEAGRQACSTHPGVRRLAFPVVRGSAAQGALLLESLVPATAQHRTTSPVVDPYCLIPWGSPPATSCH